MAIRPCSALQSPNREPNFRQRKRRHETLARNIQHRHRPRPAARSPLSKHSRRGARQGPPASPGDHAGVPRGLRTARGHGPPANTQPLSQGDRRPLPPGRRRLARNLSCQRLLRSRPFHHRLLNHCPAHARRTRRRPQHGLVARRDPGADQHASQMPPRRPTRICHCRLARQRRRRHRPFGPRVLHRAKRRSLRGRHRQDRLPRPAPHSPRPRGRRRLRPSPRNAQRAAPRGARPPDTRRQRESPARRHRAVTQAMRPSPPRGRRPARYHKRLSKALQTRGQRCRRNLPDHV